MDLRTSNKFFLYSIHRLDFITEAESVYSAVRTECLYKSDTFKVKDQALCFYIFLGTISYTTAYIVSTEKCFGK